MIITAFTIEDPKYQHLAYGVQFKKQMTLHNSTSEWESTIAVALDNVLIHKFREPICKQQTLKDTNNSAIIAICKQFANTFNMYEEYKQYLLKEINKNTDIAIS